MDILEFAFWAGCVGFILGGAFWELLKIMIKAYKRERRFKKCRKLTK